MTAVPLTAAAPGPIARLRWTLADGWAVVIRNLLHLRHEPTLLIVTLLGPVGMFLIFGYVFGSAITVPGAAEYRAFLFPGVLALVAVTGLLTTAGTVAADVDRGVVDRFRSMPMARSAVPFGQTGADVVTSTLSLALMAGCGYLAGWRFHAGVASALAAFALLVLFRYALTWAGVCLGLAVRNEAVVQQLAPLLFGLPMYSNAFVPTTGMPPVIRTISEWNPFSALIAACRELFGNPTGPTADLPLPLRYPIPATLIWIAVFLVIFVPLAVHRYRRLDG